ncbi:type 2 periplasmic-binding domain-containing protein [Paenibacillus roseipurpureus]|uniref:Extracellular solute-binding protein n=1 Tax=Paenibacillus roseopurpureus TaxID=2918901 RepID=A0AA96LKU1_9BACL|nr:extracellular solute-binding protein [Paenibacillus sp. MBLB1832]WNR42942.1 extracellular solute-binding protein [Paenibacillus sp. MBLB1832]
MSKTMKRVLMTTLTAVLATGVMAGCSQKENPAGSSSPSPLASTAETKYPLQTNAKLKVFMGANKDIAQLVSNMGETPFMKELEKRTGVKLEFIHPTVGAEKDFFNTLIASGDLPDIFIGNMGDYPGGASAAEKDGVILSLNDILPKYAPNAWNLISKDKEMDKMVKTDTGKYLMFPSVRSELGKVFAGPLLRADWLKELNLPVPETIDEWYTVLKTFKEKKGATAAFGYEGKSTPALLRDVFLGAYKTDYAFYVDDKGKVQFGAATQEYKSFLTTFHKWYEEGLIDKDFPLTDANKLKSLIDQNKTGAFIGQSGGYIRSLLDKYKTSNPTFDLVGAKYPVLKKGDTPFSGQKDQKFNAPFSAVITAKSKNVEIAAKFLDYFFTPEGIQFSNFGIENTTYKLENGKPKFTEFVTSNPNKWTSTQVQAMYSSFNGFPAVELPEKIEQLNIYKQQTEALKVWAQTDADKHAFRDSVISHTEEESKIVAKYNEDVYKYAEQMFTKFVFGSESLDNYQKYLDQLKALGVDQLIKAKQDAYDRYMKR